MVDVRHADALRLFLDGGLRLFLRAHEQDGAISLGEVAREGVRFLQELEGLLQVDDVDAAALREDEAAHLGIPASRLMAEVDPGLQQLAHGDDGHSRFLSVGVSAAGGARVEPASVERRHPHPC